MNYAGFLLYLQHHGQRIITKNIIYYYILIVDNLLESGTGYLSRLNEGDSHVTINL